jgi:ribonuclease HII
MYLVGVDENGLGPLLGPLVATAVTLEVPSADRRRLRRAGLRVGIDDSKRTSGFGRMGQTEGLVLALAEHLTGSVPADVDALLSTFCLDSEATLQRPCPKGGAFRQCWSERPALPLFGGEPDQGREGLERLQRSGIRIRRARCAIACAGVLNRELDRGRSKLAVDLALFERLLLDAREQAGEPVRAVCGMIGGIRHYPSHVSHHHGSQLQVLESRRGMRAYRFGELGRVSFEVDADCRHLQVGLASMVGKYLREVLVHRQNRFYRRRDEGLPMASGYRDPVTRRFIEQSQPTRRQLRVLDDCFVRRA